MKTRWWWPWLLAAAAACTSPAIDAVSHAVEPANPDLRVCAVPNFLTVLASCAVNGDPATQYAKAEDVRRVSCGNDPNPACARTEIVMFIAKPELPVADAYLQKWAAKARQIEAFMLTKDLNGYQVTLEWLTADARYLGSSETEALRREFETKLKATTKDKITSAGTAAVGTEQAALVEGRDAVAVVEAIHDRFTPVIRALGDRFQLLVTQYQTLRSSEAPAITSLTTAANTASTATVETIAAAIQQVAEIARAESNRTNALMLEAARLRGELPQRRWSISRPSRRTARSWRRTGWRRSTSRRAPT
jgi:hypothetical protein